MVKVGEQALALTCGGGQHQLAVLVHQAEPDQRPREPDPAMGDDLTAWLRLEPGDLVCPGKSGGRYVCGLLVSLPDSSAR